MFREEGRPEGRPERRPSPVSPRRRHRPSSRTRCKETPRDVAHPTRTRGRLRPVRPAATPRRLAAHHAGVRPGRRGGAPRAASVAMPPARRRAGVAVRQRRHDRLPGWRRQRPHGAAGTPRGIQPHRQCRARQRCHPARERPRHLRRDARRRFDGGRARGAAPRAPGQRRLPHRRRAVAGGRARRPRRRIPRTARARRSCCAAPGRPAPNGRQCVGAVQGVGDELGRAAQVAAARLLVVDRQRARR